MRSGPNIAAIGALMGDPARACILTALMSGRALTASELAAAAGVTPPTASGHLAQLTKGGLLTVEKQGRHRYYRLASADVAGAVEAMMCLATQSQAKPVRTGPKDPELRHARICYDHLAGTCGVELLARLTNAKLIALDDSGIVVTSRGESQFQEFGIDIEMLKRAKRPICKPCLDWSERRWHLAGGLGAQLLARFFELNWAQRQSGTRIVKFTPHGKMKFAKLFN